MQMTKSRGSFWLATAHGCRRGRESIPSFPPSPLTSPRCTSSRSRCTTPRSPRFIESFLAQRSASFPPERNPDCRTIIRASHSARETEAFLTERATVSRNPSIAIISEGQVAASLPHARDRPVHARDDLTHDFITMPNDHVRITSHKTHTCAGKKRYGHDYLAAAAFPRASNRVADCIARRRIRDSCILVQIYLLVYPNAYHPYATV